MNSIKMKNKILITGGAGFIGSHLVEKLHLQYDIVVLDNLNPQIHGVDGNSYTFKSIQNKCEFIKGDVQNSEDWEKSLLTGANIIIHLAAETGTGQSMYESSRYVNANCMSTALMTDILNSKKYPIKKVILASSRAVYGEGKYVNSDNQITFPDLREEIDLENGHFECLDKKDKSVLKPLPTDELSRINPLSVYGLTKYFQENILQNVCFTLGIKYIALRFQNVYGPGQSLSNPYSGIISIFSNRIKQGKELFIFEDGLESRDFVYILDVIQSIDLALNNETIETGIYNVGSGIQTPVIDVARQLSNLIDPTIEIHVTGQYRKGDIRHNYADLSKIQNELGYSSHYSFEEGLNLFVAWAKNQELEQDNYEKSLLELSEKGLLTSKKQR
jgi:dTDP-L-rhamnose 4-epimerase